MNSARKIITKLGIAIFPSPYGRTTSVTCIPKASLAYHDNGKFQGWLSERDLAMLLLKMEKLKKENGYLKAGHN